MRNAIRSLVAVCLAGLWMAGWTGAAAAQGEDSKPSSGMLKKLSLEELVDLEITSVSRKSEKLFDAASAIYIITREEIRRSGATSIPEALRLAPNLQVAQVSSREWAISARGFNNTLANKLLVMIDGRTIYTPLYAGVFWDVQDVLLEDVDRIEIISGPGGTVWGANAVNGVISIITRNSRETEGGYLTGGGGNQLQGLGGIRYGGRLARNLYYRVYSKYFTRNRTLTESGTDPLNQWRSGQGGFRADWEPSPSHQVTVQGDVYDGSVDQVHREETLFSGGNLLARWSHTRARDSNLSLQFYYDQTRRELPGIFGEHLDTYDFDSQYRFRVGDRHDVVMGLGYRLTRDRIHNISGLAFLPPQLTRQLFSAFAQDEVALVRDKVSLIVGSKFERNDYTGFEIQPSIRMTVTPSERQVIWGAVSRAVRAPSRIDQVFIPKTPPFILQGGPDFDSEDLIAYELGYRRQVRSNVSLSLVAYYHDYDRLRTIESIPRPPDYPRGLTGPFIFANGSEGKTYGAEATATYQVREWWRCRIGYTHFQKEISLKPGSTDFSSRAREGNDPKHQFSVQSSMDLPGRLELNGGFRYIGALPSPRVPDYAELDVRLGWRANKHLELSVVGQNLLHDRHPEFGTGDSRQSIERSIFGTVTWRF
ncbi:MAG TPA: TonB-dependent receptor [Blastocatellia bacterium]|nr:TonB-dependent receptor [Blastocatellia bacterium]